MSYINKEDLLTTINEVWDRKYERSNDKVLYDLYRMIIRRINRATDTDAVEVVRCKDCICARPLPSGDIRCILHTIAFTQNGFCSYGTRRTNNE